MEENYSSSLNTSHPIKWGVIKGLIAVVLNLVLFVISTELLQMGLVSFALWVINVGIIIYAGFNYRAELGGGFMNYGVAFKHAFIVMTISGIITTLYSMVLFNVIAPDYRDMLTEKQMEGMMAGGSSGEMLDTMSTIFSNMYTPLGLSVIFLVSLIFLAIGAAIIALITKKKNEQLDF